MKQTIIKVKVADLVNGYSNTEDNGVRAYGNALDIRPPYQREFVYDDKKRNKVIDTIRRGGCLNLFTWSKNEDGTYEVLDGQQRTISICEYCGMSGDDGNLTGNYAINDVYFHSLTDDEQAEILNYEIIVNVVEGTNSEKLDWFETINVAGEKLTNQELRNAIFVGTWLADAKRKFSKNGCVAYKLASKYLKGSPIRQEYLETALDWLSGGKITEYMSEHQFDKNANELWLYFSNVIEWVKTTFGEKNYRKEMQSVEWGVLYNKYKNNAYDADELEVRVKELMANEEVTDKKGVYEYILSGEDEDYARKLSKRTFSEREKRTAYEKQKGICPICGEYHSYDEMEGDHIVPWWRGGTTTLDNLQMLCKKCNGRKSGKTIKTE